MLFSKDDRVIVSDRFPPTKLAILGGLQVGDHGTVVFVPRPARQTIGIVVVQWDRGIRTNANEYDLDGET
jgi:hypothetical protein